MVESEVNICLGVLVVLRSRIKSHSMDCCRQRIHKPQEAINIKRQRGGNLWSPFDMQAGLPRLPIDLLVCEAGKQHFPSGRAGSHGLVFHLR